MNEDLLNRGTKVLDTNSKVIKVNDEIIQNNKEILYNNKEVLDLFQKEISWCWKRDLVLFVMLLITLFLSV